MSNSLRHTMDRGLTALIACLLLLPFLGPPGALANPFPDGYPRIGVTDDAIPGHSLIVGSASYMTHLFPLHTGPGSGVDQYAYCIELEKAVKYDLELFTGPWSDFPGGNNFAGDETARGKVAWIVHNSYPQRDLEDLRAVTGIPGLTQQEAIAGTQAAIWVFTNSGSATMDYSYEGIVIDGDHIGPDGSPEAQRVTALVNFLTGPANGGRSESNGPSIWVTAEDGDAGSLVGPIHIVGSEPTARVSGDPEVDAPIVCQATFLRGCVVVSQVS